MNINTDKRGSVTVEAAVVLPVFIIAILTIGFCMKAVYFQETSVFAAADKLGIAMRNAYIMPVNFKLPSEIEKAVEETLDKKVDAEVRRYFYNYFDGETEHLISMKLELNYNTGLPGSTSGDCRTTQAFLVRGFLGKDNSKEIYWSEDGYMTVYVLPDYGEKYHTEECTHVSLHPFEMRMNKQIRKQYKSCGNCRPGRVKNGTVVYIFKYGEAYHRLECGSVGRYVIEMTKGEAEIEGYSACTECGGIRDE